MKSIAQLLLDQYNGLPSDDSDNSEKLAELKVSIANALHVGVWTVEFEKVDGTLAVMECTLDSKQIPVVETTASQRHISENKDVLRVYSTDRAGWRSFRVANVKKFYKKSDVF